MFQTKVAKFILFFLANRVIREMIWRMRTASWIPEATNTHTHRVYIVCLVVTRFTGRSNSARNVFSLHINFPSRIAEFHHSTSTGHVTEGGTLNILHNDDVWADSFNVMTK